MRKPQKAAVDRSLACSRGKTVAARAGARLKPDNMRVYGVPASAGKGNYLRERHRLKPGLHTHVAQVESLLKLLSCSRCDRPWPADVATCGAMSQMLLIPDPRRLVEQLGAKFFQDAPETPGVYLMRDAA